MCATHTHNLPSLASSPSPVVVDDVLRWTPHFIFAVCSRVCRATHWFHWLLAPVSRFVCLLSLSLSYSFSLSLSFPLFKFAGCPTLLRMFYMCLCVCIHTQAPNCTVADGSSLLSLFAPFLFLPQITDGWHLPSSRFKSAVWYAESSESMWRVMLYKHSTTQREKWKTHTHRERGCRVCTESASGVREWGAIKLIYRFFSPFLLSL